eukprot:3755674-Ditylum_brightwellii.AAC.1
MENRFRLHCKVIFLRIIENIILCAILPQTEFACRATNHCNIAGPVSWGAASYMVGNSGSGGGGGGRTMFDFVIHDRSTSIIVSLTVVFVSALLLIGQVTTLDRTYLAIMGYISGELSSGGGGGGGSSSLNSSQRGKSKSMESNSGGGGSGSITPNSRRYKKENVMQNTNLLSPSSSSSDQTKKSKNNANNNNESHQNKFD